MKVSIQDLTWLVMMHFMESFGRTIVHHLEKKLKYIKDKKDQNQIKKMIVKMKEIYNHVYQLNTNLSDSLSTILNQDQQDNLENGMLAITVAIERFIRKPKAIQKLLVKCGFITDEDIDWEKRDNEKE